ncbi:WG repeat-containing protein, partial [Oscillibacter sp.]|uniref:WG repeat-containing protein n=1 Tax=Oscillibacter sp. TaxID=1945593 RepID=UPI0028B2099D
MRKRMFSTLLVLAMLAGTTIQAQAYTHQEVAVKENITYKHISDFSKGFAQAGIDANGDGLADKWGLIDSKGNEIIAPVYDDISDISDGMIKVGRDLANVPTIYGELGKREFSFFDTTGKEVLSLDYDSVEDFSEGLALVGRQYKYVDNSFGKGVTIIATKYGFINKSGKEVIPLIYDNVAAFRESLPTFGSLTPSVRKGEKFGFSEGLAVVCKDDKWGAIDTQGKVVIPFTYERMEMFFEGMAKVSKNGKVGFVNKQGKVVVPIKYDYANDFCNGLAVVSKDGGYDKNGRSLDVSGAVDKQGKLVIPMIYDYIHDFSEGLAVVSKRVGDGYDVKSGFIDTSGKLVVPMIYSAASNFSGGYAKVGAEDENFTAGLKNRYGFVNKKGEVVIPLKYDTAQDFSEGLTVVGMNMNDLDITANFAKPAVYGYIDSTGDEVIPMIYGSVQSFSNGVAKVKMQHGNYAIIKNPQYQEPTTDTAAAATDIFSDVGTSSFCYDSVNWAVKQGVTTGKTDTAFAPDETCTNAQILTFLWRAAGKPTTATSNPFSDINDGNYYYNAALWAYEKGMVGGMEFNASLPCTRSQTVAYLWQAAGKPIVSTSSSFTDVGADADYAAAINWAVEKKITSGTSSTAFSPDATCNRGQIVT